MNRPEPPVDTQTRPLGDPVSTEQTVRIMCPNLNCRRVLAVPESARGKTVRCRNCTTNIRVPMPGQVSSPPPAAAPPAAASAPTTV